MYAREGRPAHVQLTPGQRQGLLYLVYCQDIKLSEAIRRALRRGLELELLDVEAPDDILDLVREAE